ncbi:MAG: YggS family pyridoxal phosphate-dependent enzyme [Xenococcaceae cyanobacterium]
MTGSISQRIHQIRQQLPPDVRIIGVTKQVSTEAMRQAYAAGVRDFAENRLQEALSKQEQLQDLSDLTWHFIGHLQANKARKVVENFQWIHSVDNLKLAQRLDRVSLELSRQPQIFLQVKILPDPNKFGWEIDELLSDLAQLDELKHLSIRGLMTILPLDLSDAQILAAFETTYELAQKIKQQNWSHIQMNELSMGMSDDFLLASKAGSTMVRLGRIIFGERT